MILPGSTLGLLGGGQLGRMFAMAARTMGYNVTVLDPDPHAPAAEFSTTHLCADYADSASLKIIAKTCAAVTIEFENAPADALIQLAEKTTVHPGGNAVAIAQDRGREKNFFANNNFPIGPFAIISRHADIDAALTKVKLPAVLKTARFGYDGKGQARITTRAELESVLAGWKNIECVLEEFLPLRKEISVVLARSTNGETALFSIAENQHVNGILDITIAPARIDETLANQAREMATQLASKLDYVGIMAVEFFVLENGKLLINEIAPRPHNSGHFTIDACRTSQFEQQVRALCGLPLGDASSHSPSVMLNLLGDIWRGEHGELAPDWQSVLQQPNAHLHLYGKREARKGRKMGHVTVCAESVDAALKSVLEIKQHLAIR